MIFNGRTRERQPVPRTQQPAGFCRLAAGIFNRLCFVQYDVVEFDISVPHDIAAQCAIGGEHDIPFPERFRLTHHSRVACVVEHSQAWGKLMRLIDPVKDQAFGNHDERRTVGNPLLSEHLLTPQEHGQHLDCFAEAHVVGEAAAQPHTL